MLDVAGLSCGYDQLVAVRDFSFTVSAGSIHALLGANGAGKSSTIMTIAGLVQQRSGSIQFNNIDISRFAPEQRIRQGIAVVPEGRRVFADLSVSENLIVGGHVLAASEMRIAMEYVYTWFPKLASRKSQAAGSLSGGEQQMLAMGRALVSKPKLLLVDELSLGLMPKMVDECYRVLEQLKGEGIAVVLVEQDTERALSVADSVSILEAGNPVWSGSAEEARTNNTLVSTYLGMD